MTSFETGDVVSVEFPYSDLQGRKRRPGLVLSGDDDDRLLARITTRPARAAGDVALADWSVADFAQAVDGQTDQTGHRRPPARASPHRAH